MTEIEERLARLEAESQIRRLEARYCDTWDAARAEEWAAVFTEDGVFRRADVHGMAGHVKRGRTELAEFCRTLQEGYGRFHMLNTVDIDVTGDDTATSRISFQCPMTSLGDFPKYSVVTGFYDTEYRRTLEGWRMAIRLERQVFRADNAFYGVFDPAMPLSETGSTFDDAR